MSGSMAILAGWLAGAGGAGVLVAVAAALAVWWALPPTGHRRLWRGGSVGPAGWSTGVARLGAWLRRRADREHEQALRDLVPQVCELMAVCLEAGRPPRVAVRLVASVVAEPASTVLGEVVHRIDLGVDEAKTWSELKDVPGYGDIGRDLARSVRSGVGMADLLRQHAREARDRSAAAAVARARTAGVRSVVPLMLCFLPAFLLLGIVPLFGAFAAGLMG